MKPHCLHLLTGEGKGKSSAAAGMALRAAGHGWRVLYAQFMKDGTSGEVSVFRRLPEVTVFPMPPVTGFTFTMTPEQLAQTAQAQRDAAESLARAAGGCGMIVLDELATALSCGLLTDADAAALLDACLAAGETVVTGHNPSAWLTERSDYVTELLPRRHPYTDSGLPGREGIEW